MTHPAPETLAEFIDGKLRGGTRDAVVVHIEDCDDCLMIVGETARLFEEVPAEARRRSPSADIPWMMMAAALAAIVFVSAWWFRDRITGHDPIATLIAASRSLRSRPVTARLAQFDYKPLVHMRGSNTTNPDVHVVELQGIAGELCDDNAGAVDDAERQHTAGVGALLAGDSAKARQLLQRAATLAPNNAAYWNDSAVAACESGLAHNDTNELRTALEAAERSLHQDPHFSAALFNRALILESLRETSRAIRAYDDYLLSDSNSGWALEARTRRDRLTDAGRQPQ